MVINNRTENWTRVFSNKIVRQRTRSRYKRGVSVRRRNWAAGRAALWRAAQLTAAAWRGASRRYRARRRVAPAVPAMPNSPASGSGYTPRRCTRTAPLHDHNTAPRWWCDGADDTPSTGGDSGISLSATNRRMNVSNFQDRHNLKDSRFRLQFLQDFFK